jgi:hypothetical protein
MSLRLGFDMDGVLADFGSAFHQIEYELFGADASRGPGPSPEEEAERTPDSTERSDGSQPANHGGQQPAAAAKAIDRRHEAVWRRIRATRDFWARLKPMDPDAVRRLHALMLKQRWEVVFITQRPPTAGETVQRQTQRWLVQHGFDLPSVLVIAGSRGAAANALRLTHLIDDTPRNCLDVKSDSSAMPVLIGGDEAAVRQAKKLGIGVAPTIGRCLQMLDATGRARQESGVISRIAALVGAAS